MIFWTKIQSPAFVFWLLDLLSPWEKVRSLTARGPFDSLIFYQDLTFVPEDFFFGVNVDVDVGVDGGIFFFQILYNISYILHV